jgi:hypothetical protein
LRHVAELKYFNNIFPEGMHCEEQSRSASNESLKNQGTTFKNFGTGHLNTSTLVTHEPNKVSLCIDISKAAQIRKEGLGTLWADKVLN